MNQNHVMAPDMVVTRWVKMAVVEMVMVVVVVVVMKISDG
jgi:hypothetical protein